ncbi:pathogenicity-like protein [Stenotrophomonas sp. YIM B06876]|uniref:pathogenicity-like protein n=1 Tax=Stenotrophomonas sp. YIM B06876 TaxID=3060211 RepID=UPI002739A19A|nr:pathogenicity-like protein [Stenotrophomonas sp. YIM B06876]
MRQVFSSQRVETVEGVAKLLRDAGIDARITNGRSYHSKRGGQFSYLDQGNAKSYPAVWVVHAEDQPRAREVLRAARLLDTTRRDHPTAEFAFRDDVPQTTGGRSWAWRLRIGLLLVIAAVALFVVMRHRNTPAPVPAQPSQQPPASPAAPAPEQDEIRVRIQPPAPPPTP